VVQKQSYEPQIGLASPILTSKGTATRQRIIEGAAEQVRIHGVDSTSLDDVRAASRTSKSQLFHYFPEGRTQLLLAVAQHEADRVLSDQQPELADLTSWAAWQRWRDLVVSRYRSQGQTCPLGVLTSQLRPSSPEIQDIVVRLLEHWQRGIADGIRAMQAQGEIAADMDPDQAAAALLAGIQGGVVFMLATGQITHLEAVLDRGIAALHS